jgi:CspA family cold shock protein
MRGTVARYNEFRGYGFIKGDDESDYFVHWSLIEGDGYKFLSIGDRVEFNPRETARGAQAETVKVLHKKISKGLILKPNPFMPQQPIMDPNKFAGRDDAVINSVDCLFNHKNLIVTGERGIGKSSLAFQLALLSEGERALLDRFEVDTGSYEFSYLTADHRCIPGHDIMSIIESLILSAVRRLGVDLDYNKITTEVGIDVKFLKAISKKPSPQSRKPTS